MSFIASDLDKCIGCVLATMIAFAVGMMVTAYLSAVRNRNF